MTIHNAEIAAAFEEIAELLAIAGENPFRIRAYERAALIVRTLPRELAEFAGPEEIDALPGIGPDLAGKISELLQTGRLRALEKLRRQVPAGLRALLELPGLGPVRVRALHSSLGVRDIAGLRKALESGRLGKVRGFGPGIRERLRRALAAEREPGGRERIALAAATPYAESLRSFLQSLPGVRRVEIAGSYRRGRDTVGDLDAVVCAPSRAEPIKALAEFDELRELTAAGRTRASAVLRNGLAVDVRVVPERSFGAALYYFTGSRAHNIRMRRRAQERKLKLNEYGLFRGETRIAGASEAEIFTALGLPFIPPELREDRGEIDAAERSTLPQLVERADLKGDLHVHTDATDGHESLERMADAARALGLQYIAVTDHSKYLGVLRGLDAERLARQCDAIDALNERLTDLVVLKGAEVDILEDGRLALADSVLRRLDLVVIAIHGHFELSEARQTRRVLRALDRPCVSVLAHPTGRLIGERPPYALDIDRVLDAARDRPCYVEVNAQPQRLDLDDVHARAAVDRGVLLSIASDAHSAAEFAWLADGVRQARRGWATARDVLNTRPLTELRGLLRATMR